MRVKRSKAVLLFALTAVMAAGAAGADTLNVMAIGDSITYGYSYEGPDGILGNADDGGSANWFASNGGWRSPLLAQLNSNASLLNTYNFVGVKGDGNSSTVANELKGVMHSNVSPDSSGDGFDGPNNTTALHEGYGGWVIDSASQLGGSTSTRKGIRDNLTSNGGAIAPQNADVVMLMIGVNDVLGLSYGSSNYTTVDPMVANLGALINDIHTLAPGATILVSNLLPVLDGATINTDTSATVNGRISDFNAQLLEDFFGNTWLDDAMGTGVYAEHSTLANVFLLNAHSAIDSDPSAGMIYSIHNDNVHLTPDGYASLADFYEDRFVGLTVPSPSAAATMLLMLGAMVMRRRLRPARLGS